MVSHTPDRRFKRCGPCLFRYVLIRHFSHDGSQLYPQAILFFVAFASRLLSPVLYQTSNSHMDFSLPKLQLDYFSYSAWQQEQMDGSEGIVLWHVVSTCMSLYVEVYQFCVLHAAMLSLLYLTHTHSPTHSQPLCRCRSSEFRRAALGFLASISASTTACFDAAFGQDALCHLLFCC